MKKNILIINGFVVCAFASYSILTIVDARTRTPKIMSSIKEKIPNPISKVDLTERQLNQLVAIQDPNFYSHGGTDLSNGTVTTITQSLTKKLYFEDFKPGIAKIKQTLIARFALDQLFSKDEQLELFLNITYFGKVDGQILKGFNNAANAYFQKPLRDLTEEEYLKLLAMLSGPEKYGLNQNERSNAEMVVVIKKRLGI